MKAKKMLAYLIAASCILGHVTVPVYADEVPASTVDTEETEISENEKETETIIPEEAQEALPQEGVLEAEALESNIGTTPDTATKITFGETYSDHWDSSSANFHYLTFTEV